MKKKEEEPKIKQVCPEWDNCYKQHCLEFGETEHSVFEQAFNDCCGCIHCVLLRHKVGCGDNCHIRKMYPQYRDDQQMFKLACGFDPEEIAEEIEDRFGYTPGIEEILEYGVQQQFEKEKKLRKAMKIE